MHPSGVARTLAIAMKPGLAIALLPFVLAVTRSSALAAAPPAPAASRHYDLTPALDATRVLANPHKGWYHHYPDNHIEKYRIAEDRDLLEFPGMDHVYLRLAWAYLEPREGQFDWPVIDRIIEKWTAHGLGIAFRISCSETSTDRPEQQYRDSALGHGGGGQGRLLPDGPGDRSGRTLGTGL